MKQIWHWIQTLFSTLGALIGWYLGGLDGFMYTLIAFMVADYITGVMQAALEGKLSSKVGATGIARKVAIFIVIGIGHLVDFYVLDGSNNALRTALIFFYITNEAISVLENAAALGLPIPEKLKDLLEQIRNKEDPS